MTPCIVNHCTLPGKTMKHVIVITLMSVCTFVRAQTPDNLDTLNKLWQIVQQVDGQAMASVSEEKLGVRVDLPVESISPPSTVLMQSRAGLTVWRFTQSNLEALQTNISSVRYERTHYYSNNRMQYQLDIRLEKSKNCISSNDVREFLSKNKYPETALRYGGMSKPTDRIHSDYEEQRRRGNGIYSVGVVHSRLDNKPLTIWFRFDYYQCLQGVTAFQY